MLLFYYGIYMRTRQQKWEPASKNEKSAISKRVLIFAGGFSFLLAAFHENSHIEDEYAE